jgi:hypothetical protein
MGKSNAYFLDIHHVGGCIQNFPDWPPGERISNGTAHCHWVQLYRYFMVSLVSFAAITLCVASQRVFIIVVVVVVISSPTQETFGYTLVHPLQCSVGSTVICPPYNTFM